MKNVTMKLAVVDSHSIASKMKMEKSYMRMTNNEMLIDQGWTAAKKKRSD